MGVFLGGTNSCLLPWASLAAAAESWELSARERLVPSQGDAQGEAQRGVFSTERSLRGDEMEIRAMHYAIHLTPIIFLPSESLTGKRHIIHKNRPKKMSRKYAEAKRNVFENSIHCAFWLMLPTNKTLVFLRFDFVKLYIQLGRLGWNLC